MNHDILGEVEQSDGHPFDAVAKIRLGVRDIRIGISRDDQPLAVTLNLAAELVSRLTELDQFAKQLAARDLRQAYNEGWHEYDEVQDDGSLKTVPNPTLSEAEFEAKLTLKAINVTGNRMISLFYDDEGMFWGHSVLVTSLNGTDFREACAELLG
jgi:hypothetical protein